MSGQIVVGVDGSESSIRALEYAVEEARRRDADITAVLAYRWITYYPGAEFGSVQPPPRDKVEAEAMHELLEALETVPKDVPIDPVVLEGPAARVLIEAAADADLLVVGSRGRGGFAGLLLGSTSHQVVSHAPCPVLVVPVHPEHHAAEAH